MKSSHEQSTAAPARAGSPEVRSPKVETGCYHCGLPCRDTAHRSAEKSFCCQGCLAVFELLTGNGLGSFYQLGRGAGTRVEDSGGQTGFAYLDATDVRTQLVDFSNDRITRVTFRVPAIHCIACVWLLENLFRLNPAIGPSMVNFPRREVSLQFDPAAIKLSEVVQLLASIGYEPDLNLADLGRPKTDPATRRLWLQLGVAGFAFGNIMLFSIPGYFGLDSLSGPMFRKLFGLLGFALALPVLIFSARDYWRAAWISLRQRQLTLEVPIALGLVALFGQSAWDVFFGHGEGYFDSLTGLIFFLLIGRAFQRKTYDRLSFERDYKGFFPLSAVRLKDGAEERVSLASLAVRDRLRVRHGELIPSDARLVSGTALIDYGFVTGESEPVECAPGDHLYAGGRQTAGAIEVEMIKPVSRSYLTSLWNRSIFQKDHRAGFQDLTNRFSRYFTVAVIAIATGAAAYWAMNSDGERAVRSFTAVLIVACPCALALAAPFGLGTAQRVLGRAGVFLKNPTVLERLAGIDSIVFDKTGTLTEAGGGQMRFVGSALNDTEAGWLFSLARHSTHPHAVRITELLGADRYPDDVRTFLETAGKGMEARVAGHEVWMGSREWLASRGAVATDETDAAGAGAEVHVAIDGAYRGKFVLHAAVRPDADRLLVRLARRFRLALLSGDQPRERDRFRSLFGPDAKLQFNQSPLDKLGFVERLQTGGASVMMVGDGLNDAGALRQSDVGVAVVENVGGFSPASDVILAAGVVPELDDVLRYSRLSVWVVRASLLLSILYNVVGVSLAARGLMSPVICAILMPLSSITVVGFAVGLSAWLGRRWRPLQPEARA